MKKNIVAILLLSCIYFSARADHITGGEMYYTYAGFSSGFHNYNVTLKLYMRCNSGRSFPNPTIVSVFDRLTGNRVRDISVPLAQQTNISLGDAGPCISNPPVVCYNVAYYTFPISVPATSTGYLLASQVNYRISGITNINPGQYGATYTCEIPGDLQVSDAPENHSAMFTGSDLVVICANSYFSYSFAATDPDNDQIRYSFCSAYSSSTGGAGSQAAGNPPYSHLPYGEPTFSESSPLGANVQVDPNTGLITGIAPDLGVYVVTVCAEEIRDGKVIAIQRKDIQINVADCNVAEARLQPDYMLCSGPSIITIGNLSQSPLISTYEWKVLDPANVLIHTTNTPLLTYDFPSPGIYTIKLAVNKGQECSDSTTTKVFYFPGFIPDFDFTGICLTKPSFFFDNTSTVTGTVNSWKWDFGEPTTTLDVSDLQDATYTYPYLGTRDVRLIVTNTDGCRDTVIKTISIVEKPPITLAFRDTLICINDQLQLQASGMGTFSWSPAANMINANTATPLVSPAITTRYYVDINSDGCINRDSVLVRVVDHVTLQAMTDTLVCSGDTIQLRVSSDGLKYAWTPVYQLIDATAKNPLAITPNNTTYTVIATIGGCSATASVVVTAIPLPLADAGENITICYNASVQLNAATDGTSWQWSPASSLNDPASLQPIASPLSTTDYIFTAYENTRGCPKPGRDTVTVTVIPRILAYAGRDTAIVVGQSLQLSASGGIDYLWTPPANLSAAGIPNPVARFAEPSNGLLYTVKVFDEARCVDSASINVKVFATLPSVFVPTAFTPNGDGRNDELVPIAVGMKRIEYFSVYNRWGQLVFTTTINGKGWNGTIAGQPQATNTYVWVVKAIDYTGTPYFLKGQSTLIR